MYNHIDMKCDLCGQPATIQEITVKNGAVVERNLCESCAQKEKMGGASPVPPINEAILKHLMSQGAKIPMPGEMEDEADKPTVSTNVSSVRCPMCSMTLGMFKNGGLLGCASCYEALGDQIGPIIARAQEGATHHVGKIPRRALRSSRMSSSSDEMGGAAASRALEYAKRLSHLEQQLSEAVRTEQYELAAELRDELSQMRLDAGEVLGEMEGDAEGGLSNGAGLGPDVGPDVGLDES